MSGMWTSLTFHHHSISWPIDRVFRIPLVISWRPELTALLTALPRAAMLVLIVGITQAEALVLHLAPPAPSKRKKRRITTNPLITTRRFDQRRCSIATKATMLAGHRCGFHAVVSHRGHLLGEGAFVRPRACFGGASRRPSLYPIGSSFLSPPKTPPRACGHGG